MEERVTSITLPSTDDSANENHQIDCQDEQSCPEDTNTICTQNEISDLIIATEVNKMLLAR